MVFRPVSLVDDPHIDFGVERRGVRDDRLSCGNLRNQYGAVRGRSDRRGGKMAADIYRHFAGADAVISFTFILNMGNLIKDDYEQILCPVRRE